MSKTWKIENISAGSIELPDYGRTLAACEFIETLKTPGDNTRFLSGGRNALVRITCTGEDENYGKNYGLKKGQPESVVSATAPVATPAPAATETSQSKQKK